MAAASRKTTQPKREPSKLEQSGFTPQSYDACVSEAAAERGLTGGAAELFMQEAWAEMEE